MSQKHIKEGDHVLAYHHGNWRTERITKFSQCKLFVECEYRGKRNWYGLSQINTENGAPVTVALIENA